MTKEEKQILIKDLCSRLPYGVKVGFNKEGDVFTPIKFDLQTKELFAEDKPLTDNDFNKFFDWEDEEQEEASELYKKLENGEL